MTDAVDPAVPVLIAGGGPVGLTTALELAHHGVASLVVEPRAVVEHSRPRAKTTSARSMELFRRTGAAAEIRRRAALPVEWSQSSPLLHDGRRRPTSRGSTACSGSTSSGPTSRPRRRSRSPSPSSRRRCARSSRDNPLVSTRFGSRVAAVDLARRAPARDGPGRRGRGIRRRRVRLRRRRRRLAQRRARRARRALRGRRRRPQEREHHVPVRRSSRRCCPSAPPSTTGC